VVAIGKKTQVVLLENVLINEIIIYLQTELCYVRENSVIQHFPGQPYLKPDVSTAALQQLPF
jgi:hypothetical protein